MHIHVDKFEGEPNRYSILDMTLLDLALLYEALHGNVNEAELLDKIDRTLREVEN